MCFQRGDRYEAIRWPATLGFLTALLMLCVVLVIGVARSSRCTLIFFSVFGLLGMIVCWLLSGVYLASAVAMGDFCMRPNEYMCRQFDNVSGGGGGLVGFVCLAAGLLLRRSYNVIQLLRIRRNYVPSSRRCAS